MTTAAAKARTARYLSRHRAAGGKLVSVRMDAEQLARADALRLPGESRSACINRMLWIMSQPRLAQQRCAELEKDAERYRWLRNNPMNDWSSFTFNGGIVRPHNMGPWIDEAIDAVLAASPQGSSPAGAGQQETTK